MIRTVKLNEKSMQSVKVAPFECLRVFLCDEDQMFPKSFFKNSATKKGQFLFF